MKEGAGSQGGAFWREEFPLTVAWAFGRRPDTRHCVSRPSATHYENTERDSMSSTPRHEDYMRRCIELARQAMQSRDTPVGSLTLTVTRSWPKAWKRCVLVTMRRLTRKWEALRLSFAQRRSRDLRGCVLYTTVEPCIMCAYAIRLARISVVVSGIRGGDAGHAVSGHLACRSHESVLLLRGE